MTPQSLEGDLGVEGGYTLKGKNTGESVFYSAVSFVTLPVAQGPRGAP